MFRYSLRTFLIVCVAASLALSAIHHAWLQPHYKGFLYNGVTPHGLQYSASLREETDFLGRHTIKSAVVNAGVFCDDPKAVEKPPWPLRQVSQGVFFDGKRIGGYGTRKVLFVLSLTEVVVIPLSREEADSLNTIAITGFRQNALEACPTWKKRVEPEIDRLVDLWWDHDSAQYRMTHGLPY